jgi:hypothetical protein
VNVTREKQAAARSAGRCILTVLTREQIAALPDDPDEMERVLKAMAPPGRRFRSTASPAASCRRSRNPVIRALPGWT